MTTRTIALIALGIRHKYKQFNIFINQITNGDNMTNTNTNTITETWDQRIARERGEKSILKQRLVSIVTRLEGFKIKQDNEHFEAFLAAKHESGFSLILRADQYSCKGKINACIGFNDRANGERVYYKDELKVSDINEALTKDNETIAKNILKRLIPQAINSQLEINKLIEDASNKEANRNTNIEILAKIVGLPISTHMEYPSIHFFGGSERASIDIKTYYEGKKFRIELDDLTLEQAKEVSTLFKQWGKK